MMLRQLKHEFVNQHGLVTHKPMTVGLRGAVDIEVIDLPTWKERNEIAFDAFERMTFAGVGDHTVTMPTLTFATSDGNTHVQYLGFAAQP